ncbi:uncharacterized protein BO87DRAFT_34094 [Aspergillus neoniger CBS 115656]|uniref:Uncharacterized protein n=1 Tax=Aspergillus neoniger (strain CBS 115656) TaxID=1448310 RepID=A0A318YL59_ASPNB|nr:hypothetical protein BO87DRAFT_34094 [Aspergillus neoniger CBS 115656]PYH34986.1 hypothetical protein BO87DRAFT_34094 [Aspergillus neoniger CBS 115656]
MNEGKKRNKDDGLRDKHQNGHCFRPPLPPYTTTRSFGLLIAAQDPRPLHLRQPISIASPPSFLCIILHPSGALTAVFEPVIPPEEVVDTDHSLSHTCFVAFLTWCLVRLFLGNGYSLLSFYYYQMIFFLFTRILHLPIYFIFLFFFLSLPFLLRLILCMYAGKVKKEGSIILGERY